MESLKNITFRQFVQNCEALKLQYEELLTPFFDVQVIRCWKTMIYSLQIEEWRRDRLWEFLNDDYDIEELEKLI